MIYEFPEPDSPIRQGDIFAPPIPIALVRPADPAVHGSTEADGGPWTLLPLTWPHF